MSPRQTVCSINRHFLSVWCRGMKSFLPWPSRPYDLRQAFMLGVLLPLAVLTASVVVVMINWAERSLESRLQGEIELISRAVAPSISSNLDAGRSQEIRRSLESLFSIRRVYGAAVYDGNGDLVVAAGTADQEVRTSEVASDVVRTGEDGGRYRSVDGRNVYSYFSPLIDHGGRIHGLLQITRDRREIDATLQQVSRLAWSYWFLAVILSVAITLLLYRRLVGRHVRALLDRMNALARGARNVTFQASSPREFSEIGGGFNTMVSAIRKAEDELRERQHRERQLERQLQESERVAVIGRVAQGLAHELGSPLSVIDGRVRRLEREEALAGFSQALQDVRRQVERMTGIVRQLLNYGRSEEGDRKPVGLRELLDRVGQGAAAEGPDISIAPGGTDISVCGDPVRLELAVSNLLRNALRHAEARVAAGVSRDAQGCAILWVEDDGPGVAAEDLPHIFQPFYTRQPPGKGTGLGLAIVASVMHEHDGEAHYEPGSQGGARFVLRFASSAPSGESG